MADKPKIEIDAYLYTDAFVKSARDIQIQMDKVDSVSQRTGLSKAALNKAIQEESKAVKTSTMSWTEFNSVLSIGQQALRVGQQIFDETITKHLEYADSVRDLSLITNESAEDTSRVIQVFDDFKISTSQLTPILKAMTKEGLSPNIETIAKLSDEYIKIQDPVKKAEFLFKTFGRAGDDLALVMSKGGDALLEMNGAVSENLILTQKQIDQARELELNQDKLRDNWDGVTNQIATKFVPALNDAFQVQQRMNELIKDGVRPVEAQRQAFEELQREQTLAASVERELAIAKREGMDITIESTQATEDATVAVEDLSKANTEFLSVLGNMQSEADSFSEKYKKINEDANLSDDERIAKIQELEAEHDLANKKIMLGLLERKLMQDGVLDDKELEWLLRKGEAWGIYSQTVVDETMRMIAEADNLATALSNLPTEGSFTYYLNTAGSIEGVNISSGGGNQRVQRNAFGGDYMIPQSYGNEGFMMGGAGGAVASASGGERLKVIPKGQSDSNSMDYNKLARAIVGAMQTAGG